MYFIVPQNLYFYCKQRDEIKKNLNDMRYELYNFDSNAACLETYVGYLFCASFIFIMIGLINDVAILETMPLIPTVLVEAQIQN